MNLVHIASFFGAGVQIEEEHHSPSRHIIDAIEQLKTRIFYREDPEGLCGAQPIALDHGLAACGLFYSRTVREAVLAYVPHGSSQLLLEVHTNRIGEEDSLPASALECCRQNNCFTLSMDGTMAVKSDAYGREEPMLLSGSEYWEGESGLTAARAYLQNLATCEKFRDPNSAGGVGAHDYFIRHISRKHAGLSAPAREMYGQLQEG